MTSRCCSVGFCIAFCVVTALNSWAVQSEASISAVKYKCLPFLGSHVEIIFGFFFPAEDGMKQKK